MSKLRAGIVGLPNAGKSTLFNALTKQKIEAANYPFATIEPNIGIVNVPDQRLEKLSQIVNSQKTIPAIFEFTDIAGLVKGASKGEGLGNQFLANIRDVDAIIHVVRAYEDSQIIHVNNEVNPINDIEIINLELFLSDLEIVEKRIEKVKKKAELKDKEALFEFNILEKVKTLLLKNQFLTEEDWNKEEEKFLKNFNLITFKKMIYIANLSEEQIKKYKEDENFKKINQLAKEQNKECLAVCCKLEEELSNMEKEDKLIFLNELNINQTGLDQIIQKTYNLLDLKTFFTAGEKEVRAWTFKKGYTAPQCAGIIHTDFETGFIKAEVISFDDFVKSNGWNDAKNKGLIRLEGKEYLFNDGDIAIFKFNN